MEPVHNSIIQVRFKLLISLEKRRLEVYKPLFIFDHAIVRRLKVMPVGNYEPQVLIILSERLRDHESIFLNPRVELLLLFSLGLSQVFGLDPSEE